MCVAAFIIIALQPLCYYIAELYTEDANMIDGVTYNLRIYLVSLYLVANIQYSLAGIIKGLGL